MICDNKPERHTYVTIGSEQGKKQLSETISINHPRSAISLSFFCTLYHIALTRSQTITA